MFEGLRAACRLITWGTGGYCHVEAIWVRAAVKGMVLKQFSLGKGIDTREF